MLQRKMVAGRATVVVTLLLTSGCTPSIRQLHLLDRQSFAFDAIFLSGDKVACALLEEGEYRLASYQTTSGRRTGHLRLAGGEHWLHDLAVDRQGRTLAAALRLVTLRDGRLRAAGQVLLFDLAAGKLIGQRRFARPVRTVAFVGNGLLAAGTEAAYDAGQRPRPGTAQLCLLQRDARLRVCRDLHADTVATVARLPSPIRGARLISGSWDATLRLWSTELEPRGRFQTGAKVNAVALAQTAPLAAVATSVKAPRRSRAVVAAERANTHRDAEARHAVQLWNLATGQHTTLHRHTAPAVTVVIDAEGELVASGGWDWRVWVGGTKRPGVTLEVLSQIPTGMALDARGRLAVASWTAHGSGAPSCALFDLRR